VPRYLRIKDGHQRNGLGSIPDLVPTSTTALGANSSPTGVMWEVSSRIWLKDTGARHWLLACIKYSCSIRTCCLYRPNVWKAGNFLRHRIALNQINHHFVRCVYLECSDLYSSLLMLCGTINITLRQREDEVNILQSGDSAHDMELNLQLRIAEMLRTFKHRKLNVEMWKDILEYINYNCKYVTVNRRVSFARGICLLCI
jgi:hypothetical protein